MKPYNLQVVDGARVYYVSEISQVPYNVTHIWNLRNKSGEHGGRKKRKRGKQTVRGLLTVENTLGVVGGKVRGMG